MAAILLVGLLLNASYIFDLLETIATLAVIVIYGMANLALTRYMRREQPAHFTVLQHLVAPWLGTLALLPVLFVTVYPEPAWPNNITPYVFAVSLLAGFTYMQWREWRKRGALHGDAVAIVRDQIPSPPGTT